MCCLRVKDLNEYLVAPLIEALRDNDNYVKKIAILSVPKINELSPDLVAKSGMVQKLQLLLKNDSNPYIIYSAL